MNWAKRFNAVLLGTALTAGAGLAAIPPARADLDIASVPLHLTGSASPNLMFVLDDSGSMAERTSFPFNPITNLIHHIYSSDDNFIYYNPEVRYRPWVNADGTYFPEAGIPTEAELAAGLPDRYLEFSSPPWVFFRTQPLVPSPPTLFHYYRYLGAGPRSDIASYEQVLIRPDTAPFVRGSAREDCAAAGGGGLHSCTFMEEVQNFANWFEYHSTRMKAAKAAIGYSFVDQAESVRVGFARINQILAQDIDGVLTPTIIQGVRAFDEGNRRVFFDTLYESRPSGRTPLLFALEQVGRYFERSDERGPWADEPGVGGGEQSSCRQNYALMMSDGAATDPWPMDPALAGNVDGSAGEEIVSADGDRTFQYLPEAPFADRWSGTLADVAMHFWKRDLRPDLPNNVPPLCFSEDCTSPSEDPAFWQHMVFYGVGFGVKGTLDPDQDLDDLTSGAKNWPDAGRGVTAEGPRIDDMWHATVNGRGRYFSATNPQELADSLQEALASIAARTSSSSALAANSTKLDAGTLTFQGLFSASSWRGDLRAFKLDPDDGSIADQAWSAAAVMPAPDDRNIFTSDGGSSGMVFQWAALSGAQRAALDNDPELLAYLRGDQSLEVEREGGRFRTRFVPEPAVDGAVLSPLGDIVNSNPFFTGAENFGLSVLNPEGGSYGAYLHTKAQRPQMVYVNANDGMLHAFRASDGVELFAFMPDAVIRDGLADLADPGYRHRYFNDGQVRVSDAYIGGRWRTILVGSLGAGGRAVFALDVTDPENFDENDVLWEFTDSGLGFPLGQPTVARTAGGDWVAVISNGYNSNGHKSRLYILDLATGNVLKEINTGVGSAGNPNGMGTPLPVDTNADRITDALYAGDLHGKLWKVDMTDANPGEWGLLTDDSGAPSPLFSAHDENGNPQPITGRPEAGHHPEHGVMVYFGTGKLFENGDQFDDAPQTLYGIWDMDLPVPPGDRDAVLLQQEILGETLGHFGGEDLTFRVTTGETIDWSVHWGWYMDLTDVGALGAGERVVSNPVLRNGRIIFATVVPNADPCGSGGTSWLIELDAITGGRVTEPPFDLNEDNEFDADDMVEYGGDKLPPSGIKIADQLTTPVIVEVDRDVEVKHLGGASTAISTVRERAGGGAVRRHSWRQLQ